MNSPEPVLLGLTPAIITGAFTAIANLLNAWGILVITQDQLDALNNAVVPIMLVLVVGGSLFARAKSTSLASPVIPQGTTITVQTPPGQDDQQVTV